MGAPRKEVCGTRTGQGISVCRDPAQRTASSLLFFCCTAPRRGQCQQSFPLARAALANSSEMPCLPKSTEKTASPKIHYYPEDPRAGQRAELGEMGSPQSSLCSHFSFLLSPHFSAFHKIQVWHLISVGLYRSDRYRTAEGALFIRVSPCKTHLKRAAERTPAAPGYCSLGRPSPCQVITSLLVVKPLSAAAVAGLISLPRQKGGFIS